MLAYGDCGPGFDSRHKLRFFSNFSSRKYFSTTVSARTTLTLGLFLSLNLNLFLYSLLVSHSSFPYFFLEFLCKLHKAHKSLSSLSLSLLGPSFQDETGAARLQRRQKKRENPNKPMATISCVAPKYPCDLIITLRPLLISEGQDPGCEP